MANGAVGNFEDTLFIGPSFIFSSSDSYRNFAGWSRPGVTATRTRRAIWLQGSSSLNVRTNNSFVSYQSMFSDDTSSQVPRQTWADVTVSDAINLKNDSGTSQNMSLCLIKKWFTTLSKCQSDKNIIEKSADYRSKSNFLLSIP